MRTYTCAYSVHHTKRSFRNNGPKIITIELEKKTRLHKLFQTKFEVLKEFKKKRSNGLAFADGQIGHFE